MCSKEYKKFLNNHNFIYSYTSLNHSCDENAVQEAFHSLLKRECYIQKGYILLMMHIGKFHYSLGYISSVSFEKI